MAFTQQIIVGLVLGIALGLFFGESVGGLSMVGEVYIGLLQMTVLPYIMLSLIVNLGQISWRESRGLLTTLVAVFTIFLLAGAAILALTPVAFPPAEAASFFSRALIANPEPIDFVALYVPANPFASMANNLVPAVVLFSILLGVGLSGVSGRDRVISALDTVSDALNRVNKLVVKLTPYGVFAIAGGTAGTMSLEELGRLQGFLLSYTALVAVVAFVVLPLFVAAVTPFSAREFLAIPRNSLITIFAAGKIIILMPQLVENIRELFNRHNLLDEDTEHGAGILLPLAYPFPNLGTYLILSFVVFAAWYLGRPMDLADILTLEAASVFSSFIAPVVGVPFLLDVLELPADVMELFIVSTVYTDRIRVVLGAVHLLALTAVVLAIRRGVFRVNPRKLAIAAVASVAALLVALIGTRVILDTSLARDYDGANKLLHIEWMSRPVAAVRAYHDTLPEVESADAGPRLQRVPERGSLRVGYLPDALPWAFRNEAGVETGFDIEMANQLAGDLGVGLELIRIEEGAIADRLAEGHVDIVMSGLARTADRLRRYRFAGEPVTLTLGVLVPDYRRKAFANSKDLRRRRDLQIGLVQNDPAFARQLQTLLPDAEFVILDSPREFLRGNRPELDGVLYSAEGGAAWTLIYPDYSIVVPQPNRSQLATGYLVPNDDPDWANYIDAWVDIKRRDGTVDALFDHWIEGGGADVSGPRWSIARDVLGWGVTEPPSTPSPEH